MRGFAGHRIWSSYLAGYLHSTSIHILAMTHVLCMCQEAANAAVQDAVAAFKARHAGGGVTVQFFDFASLQRTFKTQATQLGFIDTVNPWCASPLSLADGNVTAACTNGLASERL